ncbi:MAG: rhomboid family intramembrane serine protease [Gemmatimonadota bacterium]|nr:rhomboid family intramembrane serine protease [Gemmatimonadota bacterium]
MFPMTPWVTRLLVANLVVFIVIQTSPGLYRDLAFIPQVALFRPWTVVTYMFLHADFGHLFFNMIGVFFFGPRLEMKLGGSAFMRFYLFSGIGGALFQTVFATAAPMVGASAGVYAVLVGFAYYWPRETILLFPIPIPIQAWILVSAYVFMSIFNGVTGSSSGVAHFAHLGGAVVGFLFLKWLEWRRGSAKRGFQTKLKPEKTNRGFVGDRNAMARWKGISVNALHELNREEVERLLDKVKADGPSSLSESEREFLDRMATR